MCRAHVNQGGAARSSRSRVLIKGVWLAPKRSRQRRAFSSSSGSQVLGGETGLPYLGRGDQDLRQAEEGKGSLLPWVGQVALQALGQVQRQGLQARCRACRMVLANWRGRSIFVVGRYHC